MLEIYDYCINFSEFLNSNFHDFLVQAHLKQSVLYVYCYDSKYAVKTDLSNPYGKFSENSAQIFAVQRTTQQHIEIQVFTSI